MWKESKLFVKVDGLNVGWCILTVLYHQQKEKALRIWLLMSNNSHILKIIGGQECFPMVPQTQFVEYQIKYWGYAYSAFDWSDSFKPFPQVTANAYFAQFSKQLVVWYWILYKNPDTQCFCFMLVFNFGQIIVRL